MRSRRRPPKFMPGRRTIAPGDGSLLEWAAREGPLGLLAVGHDGCIAAANTAACRLLIGPQAPMGRHLTSLVHHDDRHWFAPALERLLHAGGELSHELRLVRHRDEAPLWIQLHLRAIVPPTVDVPLVAAVFEDVSARRRRDERLHRLVDADPLTGLFNRRRLDGELALHLERGRRYGPHGSLLLIDIDDLKGINDRGGHAAGDTAILATAALLRSRVRRSDVIARIGGDEFAVLLFDGTATQAEAVARDLLATTVVALNGKAVPRPPLSVGIAAVEGEACEPESLRARADGAMYLAKRAGGERIAIAGADATRDPAPAPAPEVTGADEAEDD